jgi:predicted ester cyclase
MDSSPSEVARLHDEAYNAKDVEGRKRLCSADLVLEMPGGLRLQGIDQILQIDRVFWAAIPDGRISRDTELVAGNTVITEGVLTGTQSGPFIMPQGEIPPSGNPVNLRYASVKRIVDGKIVEIWALGDFYGLLTQIDALPTPEAATSGAIYARADSSRASPGIAQRSPVA